MHILITASFRAVRSVFAPGMLRLFIFSVALTILMLIGFTFLASSGFIWLSAHAHMTWIAWIGSIGAGLIAWFLFPGIMPVIVSFFDNRIAGLIEARDYPGSYIQPAKPWPEFWHDVRFALFTLGLNIIVLPLYLVPVLNIVLFYLLNGYLLGREFFVMAARRHVPLDKAEALRKKHSRIILIAGMMLAFFATVPLLNLFAPFWGVAMMTHLYHQLCA